MFVDAHGRVWVWQFSIQAMPRRCNSRKRRPTGSYPSLRLEGNRLDWRNIAITLVDAGFGVSGNIRIAVLDQTTRAIQIDRTLPSVHLI